MTTEIYCWAGGKHFSRRQNIDLPITLRTEMFVYRMASVNDGGIVSKKKSFKERQKIEL